MFRSIRWRLVTSYVLITLLTVSVLGVITYTLIRSYIETQESAFLTANAEAIESRARLLMSPVVQYEDLEELARAVSMLGNLRVIIHNNNQEIIVDTGSPTHIDHFLWIRPEVQFNVEPSDRPLEPFIMPIIGAVEPDASLIHETVQDLINDLPAGVHYEQLELTVRPWGNMIRFKDADDDRGRTFAASHSTRSFRLPIGEREDPLGYVEVLEGPDFGSETLRTTQRAFMIAAISAVLLSGGIGLFISHRLASPIVQLSTIADQMSRGDLSVRSPEFGKDEIGQLSQRFNQMAEALEGSFNILSSERDTLRRFISDASHELRTPITAMKNFIELLQGEAMKDTTARDEFLQKSQNQLDRMEWITQNLLDLSRLEAGLTSLNLSQRDVHEILNTIFATVKEQAEKKDIQFLVDQPDPSFELLADHSLLETALLNLVDNALKFTSQGGKIKLSAHEGDDRIRFTITDTGSGIDTDDLPHIFERFYRGQSVDTEGSGLGLSMVESVVKTHGGSVEVESEPGIGSTFTIELPKQIEQITDSPIPVN